MYPSYVGTKIINEYCCTVWYYAWLSVIFVLVLFSEHLLFNEPVHSRIVLLAFSNKAHCGSCLPLLFHFPPDVGIPFSSVFVPTLFVRSSCSIPPILGSIVVGLLILASAHRGGGRWRWLCSSVIISSLSPSPCVHTLVSIICIHLRMNRQATSSILLHQCLHINTAKKLLETSIENTVG